MQLTTTYVTEAYLAPWQTSMVELISEKQREAINHFHPKFLNTPFFQEHMIPPCNKYKK